MRITKYSMKLNEDWINCLVKESAKNYSVDIIDTPEKAAKLVTDIFDAGNLSEEYMWMIALDTARRVKGVFEVSHGTLGSSLVHPREIFARAILAGSASIIIAHNHPGGSLNISESDRDVSYRIKQAGELIGIRLDDHIIIAGDCFVSAI